MGPRALSRVTCSRDAGDSVAPIVGETRVGGASWRLVAPAPAPSWSPAAAGPRHDGPGEGGCAPTNHEGPAFVLGAGACPMAAARLGSNGGTASTPVRWRTGGKSAARRSAAENACCSDTEDAGPRAAVTSYQSKIGVASGHRRIAARTSGKGTTALGAPVLLATSVHSRKTCNNVKGLHLVPWSPLSC